MQDNFSKVIAIVGNVIMTSSKNAASEISEKSNSILREVKKTCITSEDCESNETCTSGVCVANSSGSSS